MKTTVFKRSAGVSLGLLLAGLVTGCSGSQPARSESPAPKPSAEQSGPQIDSPKDAAAKDVCALLPPEGATSLGLQPTGEFEENMIDPDAPAGCAWRDGSGNSVTLTPLSDRSLQIYLDNRAQYPDFEELAVAGHPAVRANEGDPAMDGFCNVFLGTKDGQVLASQTDINSPEEFDPCGLAQKALEASVPTLPAAN